MLANRVKRMVEKNRSEALGILLRRFPPFVWSNASAAEIPAFTFHAVTEKSLERALEYLAENQYRTLTADEYVERVVEGKYDSKQEVLLTFDDGHESLYTIAFPILRRLGQKAVAYIVPGYTADGASNSEPRGYPHRQLCTWQQVKEMHRNGVVDFQSHSMYHHSIAVSNRVVDFLRPGLDKSFLKSDLAPIVTLGDGGAGSLHNMQGYPVHKWGARMAAAPEFRESPEVIDSCIEYVASNGAERFFARRNWRRLLKTLLRDTRRRHPSLGFETVEEQRTSILKDLLESKAEIERNLPGKAARHFCFPWFRGSSMALELSARAGYISNAWGSLLPKWVDPNRKRPKAIARLPWYYIWRLPGEGRVPIAKIICQHLTNSFGTGARVPGLISSANTSFLGMTKES